MEIQSRSWEPRSSSGHVSVRYNHIITSYKATTDVVSLRIDESAVLDSEVMRFVKSARRSRHTEYKFVRHFGSDWVIIWYSNRISTWSALGPFSWSRHSIKIISTFTNSCMDAQAYEDAVEPGGSKLQPVVDRANTRNRHVTIFTPRWSRGRVSICCRTRPGFQHHREASGDHIRRLGTWCIHLITSCQ
jgi:hypothetical protein